MKKIKILGKKKKKEKPEHKAKFLEKLYSILDNKDFSKYIKWKDDGLSFIILDQFYFAQHVLPIFYNHHNFSSFNRQLNNYNFRNISLNKKEIEYKHDIFNKFINPVDIKLIKKEPKLVEIEINKNKDDNITDIQDIINDKEDDFQKKILKLNEKEKLNLFKQTLNKKELTINENKSMLNFLLDKLSESIDEQNNLKTKFEDLTNQYNNLKDAINVLIISINNYNFGLFNNGQSTIFTNRNCMYAYDGMNKIIRLKNSINSRNSNDNKDNLYDSYNFNINDIIKNKK